MRTFSKFILKKSQKYRHTVKAKTIFHIYKKNQIGLSDLEKKTRELRNFDSKH
jgi:hypothetical protein